MILIIRTSDRGSFKRCRKSWDYGSKIRKNLTVKGPAPKPLDFGTAIHYALEVLYTPETWTWDRDVIEGLAMVAFEEIQATQLKGYLLETGNEGITDEELRVDYNERWDLGRGMLHQYFAYSRIRDVNWTPVAVELEFEVEIEELREWAHKHGYEKVVYQGRIDLVIKDELGRFWVIDHKTAARFDNTGHLAMDPQVGSYAWALQRMLGIPVAGVIYNELYKGYPKHPDILKSGKVSKNKQQDTTASLYRETLMDVYGYIPDEYDDFIEFLEHKESEYFRRTRVHRSPEELRILGENIAEEAMDIGDPNLRIYPNPTKFNCNFCMFRAPCLAYHEGNDEAWIIKNNYKTRDADDEPIKLDF